MVMLSVVVEGRGKGVDGVECVGVLLKREREVC